MLLIVVMCVYTAASCGHEGVVKLLLALGGDRTARDSNGDSPEDVCDTSVKDVFRTQPQAV